VSTAGTLPVARTRRPLLARVALPVAERALRGLEAGALEVRLPGGERRRFGSGAPVRMEIADERLLARLATQGSIGLGESYQAGEWRADDLVGFFELLLRNAEAGRRRHPRLSRFLQARPRLNRRQGPFAARRNVQAHYDLGNALFELMLDPSLTYSCAIFDEEGEPLEDAQLRKLRRVCERLELAPGEHVLEIGSGWGSFALVAAQEYDARVTGLTLSPAQAALARERVAAAGLEDRVTILEEDYREHERSGRGAYDKVASIEMFEAIGERQHPTFFAAVDRLLAPGGSALVQTILVPDERWPRYRRTPDWIERHVFPGCLIPSLGALRSVTERASSLRIGRVEEIGAHYAETLRRWRSRFHESLDEVRTLGYDERFIRTWDFYLSFCEAAFRTRWLGDAQLLLTR
jgi:cyclopropane-fatty-acyl-phospholipid synthase